MWIIRFSWSSTSVYDLWETVNFVYFWWCDALGYAQLASWGIDMWIVEEMSVYVVFRVKPASTGDSVFYCFYS